ncbi:MAG: hypothetical protein JSW50_15590 [Candidatus Latescibacterota bacterium]|nr:MAG: hypothetical protein JSW50_15590 [Candidatus Latescibacterota bacterium]
MRVLLAAAAALIIAVPASAGIITSHLSSDADMIAAIRNVAAVAEGRIGDLGGVATFELDIGDDTGNPASTAQHAWQNGVSEPFALAYDPGTNLMSFTLDGKTLTYSPALSFREIFVRTRAVNDGSSVHVRDLVINGESVEDFASAAGPDGLDILAISGVELYEGFTMTGTANLAWTETPPTNSRLAFQIKIGDAPTVPVEASTWGKIKSLFR